MHFKPLGSSAVVELHKLTDYISGHLFEEQFTSFNFHFHSLDQTKPTSIANLLQWEGGKLRLRPHGSSTTFIFVQTVRFLATGLQQGGVTQLGESTPPSTDSSCLKSNFLDENERRSSSSAPPTPLGSTCRLSTLLLMVFEGKPGRPPT